MHQGRSGSHGKKRKPGVAGLYGRANLDQRVKGSKIEVERGNSRGSKLIGRNVRTRSGGPLWPGKPGSNHDE